MANKSRYKERQPTRRGGQRHERNTRKKGLKKARKSLRKVRNDRINNVSDSNAVPMVESNDDRMDVDPNDNNNDGNVSIDDMP